MNKGDTYKYLESNKLPVNMAGPQLNMASEMDGGQFDDSMLGLCPGTWGWVN